MSKSAVELARPTGVLILHGWTNRRPAEHWQHHLAKALQQSDIPVEYPDLADTDNPEAAVWDRQALEGLFALPAGHRVLVAHSASTWTAIRLVLGAHRSHNSLPVDRILLVAPVSTQVLTGIAELAAFHPEVDDREIKKALAHIPRVDLVASDDDEYFPGGGGAGWGHRIGAHTHELSGQGHLALGDGYGDWPSVLEWVLGNSSRIVANR